MFSDHPTFEKKVRQTTQPLEKMFSDHPAFGKKVFRFFLVCHHSMASLDFWLRPNQSRKKVAAAAMGAQATKTCA